MINHEEIWKLIVHSNVLNFSLFLVILYFIQKKFLKTAKAEKNEQIISELQKAQSRYNKAEKELKKANDELLNFETNLNKMKEEQEQMLDKLRTSIEAENAQKIERIENKHKEEIQRLINEAKNELKKEVLQKISHSIEQKIIQEPKLAESLHRLSFEKI